MTYAEAAAWLLREDGVYPVKVVRLPLWPGTAVVRHPGGQEERVLRANLLAVDDLERRWTPPSP